MGKGKASKNDKLMSLLLEYLKDSNTSDKQLAKTLGVSQPTISRMRSKLLAEGMIRNFSVFPDFAKMGYEIMAFSFVKFNMEKLTRIRASTDDWIQNNPCIIFSSLSEGLGMDALTISLHKNYADYKNFVDANKIAGNGFVAGMKYVLVDLKGGVAKPLSLKYLAEKSEKQDEPESFG